MIIDIRRTILQKNLGNFIATIVFLLIIVALLFIPFSFDFIPGIGNTLLAIFFAVAYVIHAFYKSFRNYNYVYFSDESDKIILRYFSPGFFTSKKNAIEIPKKEYSGYVLRSFLMGYRETISLQRQTPKGTASYPPVSITALSAQERRDLLFTLNSLKPKQDKK